MNRPGPFRANGGAAPHHAQNRARRRGVAIGIKTGVYRQTDGLSIIPFAVKQRRRHHHGIGNHVAPVVQLVFVEALVNFNEADLGGNALFPSVDYGAYRLVQPAAGGNLGKARANDLFHVPFHRREMLASRKAMSAAVSGSPGLIYP